VAGLRRFSGSLTAPPGCTTFSLMEMSTGTPSLSPSSCTSSAPLCTVEEPRTTPTLHAGGNCGSVCCVPVQGSHGFTSRRQ
jgi:hypothetical protein